MKELESQNLLGLEARADTPPIPSNEKPFSHPVYDFVFPKLVSDSYSIMNGVGSSVNYPPLDYNMIYRHPDYASNAPNDLNQATTQYGLCSNGSSNPAMNYINEKPKNELYDHIIDGLNMWRINCQIGKPNQNFEPNPNFSQPGNQLMTALNNESNLSEPTRIDAANIWSSPFVNGLNMPHTDSWEGKSELADLKRSYPDWSCSKPGQRPLSEIWRSPSHSKDRKYSMSGNDPFNVANSVDNIWVNGQSRDLKNGDLVLPSTEPLAKNVNLKDNHCNNKTASLSHIQDTITPMITPEPIKCTQPIAISEGPSGIQAVLHPSLESGFSSKVPKRTSIINGDLRSAPFVQKEDGKDEHNFVPIRNGFEASVMDINLEDNSEGDSDDHVDVYPLDGAEALEKLASGDNNGLEEEKGDYAGHMAVPYHRSSSGNLYFNRNENGGSPKKYMEYRASRNLDTNSTDSSLIPKFQVVENGKSCQTETNDDNLSSSLAEGLAGFVQQHRLSFNDGVAVSSAQVEELLANSIPYNNNEKDQHIQEIYSSSISSNINDGPNSQLQISRQGWPSPTSLKFLASQLDKVGTLQTKDIWSNDFVGETNHFECPLFQSKLRALWDEPQSNKTLPENKFEHLGPQLSSRDTTSSEIQTNNSALPIPVISRNRCNSENDFMQFTDDDMEDYRGVSWSMNATEHSSINNQIPNEWAGDVSIQSNAENGINSTNLLTKTDTSMRTNVDNRRSSLNECDNSPIVTPNWLTHLENKETNLPTNYNDEEDDGLAPCFVPRNPENAYTVWSDGTGNGQGPELYWNYSNHFQAQNEQDNNEEKEELDPFWNLEEVFPWHSTDEGSRDFLIHPDQELGDYLGGEESCGEDAESCSSSVVIVETQDGERRAVNVEYLDDETYEEIMRVQNEQQTHLPTDHTVMKTLKERYLPPSQRPCSYFMENACKRKHCKFSHDLENITCKYWLEGSCYKGDSCQFLHGYPEVSQRRNSEGDKQSRRGNILKMGSNFELNSDSDFPALGSGNSSDRECDSSTGLLVYKHQTKNKKKSANKQSEPLNIQSSSRRRRRHSSQRTKITSAAKSEETLSQLRLGTSLPSDTLPTKVKQDFSAGSCKESSDGNGGIFSSKDKCKLKSRKNRNKTRNKILGQRSEETLSDY